MLAIQTPYNKRQINKKSATKHIFLIFSIIIQPLKLFTMKNSITLCKISIVDYLEMFHFWERYFPTVQIIKVKIDISDYSFVKQLLHLVTTVAVASFKWYYCCVTSFRRSYLANSKVDKNVTVINWAEHYVLRLYIIMDYIHCMHQMQVLHHLCPDFIGYCGYCSAQLHVKFDTVWIANQVKT
jgi:hypothetical protein